MIRRIVVWGLCIAFGLLAALALGVAALVFFPLGCPVAKHLPDTVTEVTCNKNGNFPEMWYRVEAQSSRAAFEEFLAALQQQYTDAEWDVERKGQHWIRGRYVTHFVLLTTSWNAGELHVDMRQH